MYLTALLFGAYEETANLYEKCIQNPAKNQVIYDRHPELQSKWDKAFWTRGYYVETIGNITDEAVQKYIKEQAEESRREDSSSTAL